MAALRHIIERLTAENSARSRWIEMVRDLQAPIAIPLPNIHGVMRWANQRDIPQMAALEGFVKEFDVMERSLRHRDRGLLLEHGGKIAAFAWITFRDYRLTVWHTLHLPPRAAYLVYIFVRPEYRRQGLGAYLLGCVMQRLREMGCHELISGMMADWSVSRRLHHQAGFRLRRKLVPRRLLRVIPYPPKEVSVEE
jgi:GNAT superfamily N-acetyltransferase